MTNNTHILMERDTSDTLYDSYTSLPRNNTPEHKTVIDNDDMVTSSTYKYLRYIVSNVDYDNLSIADKALIQSIYTRFLTVDDFIAHGCKNASTAYVTVNRLVKKRYLSVKTYESRGTTRKAYFITGEGITYLYRTFELDMLDYDFALKVKPLKRSAIPHVLDTRSVYHVFIRNQIFEFSLDFEKASEFLIEGEPILRCDAYLSFGDFEAYYENDLFTMNRTQLLEKIRRYSLHYSAYKRTYNTYIPLLISIDRASKEKKDKISQITDISEVRRLSDQLDLMTISQRVKKSGLSIYEYVEDISISLKSPTISLGEKTKLRKELKIINRYSENLNALDSLDVGEVTRKIEELKDEAVRKHYSKHTAKRCSIYSQLLISPDSSYKTGKHKVTLNGEDISVLPMKMVYHINRGLEIYCGDNKEINQFITGKIKGTHSLEDSLINSFGSRFSKTNYHIHEEIGNEYSFLCKYIFANDSGSDMSIHVEDIDLSLSGQIRAARVIKNHSMVDLETDTHAIYILSGKDDLELMDFIRAIGYDPTLSRYKLFLYSKESGQLTEINEQTY